MNRIGVVIGIIILVPLTGYANSDIGMWKSEDCKKVSDAAGYYLYLSGEIFKKASVLKKSGDKKKSFELYKESLFLSELSANHAKNFEVFCVKNKHKK